MKTTQRTNPSKFNLRDSSISNFEIADAVSRSLLMSSATMAQPMLDIIKNKTGLTAANFNFAEYHSVLTNPLTYPRSRDTKGWMESLVQKGYVPTDVGSKTLRILDFDSIVDAEMNINDRQSRWSLVYGQNGSYEKIGHSDVSLNVYNSIADLRNKYYFDKGVSSFLMKNDTLIHFLSDAHQELVSKISSAIFSLEVKSDPEIEEWITLYLYVTPVQHSELFNMRLQDFINNWMFRQNGEVRKLVTIADRVF